MSTTALGDTRTTAQRRAALYRQACQWGLHIRRHCGWYGFHQKRPECLQRHECSASNETSVKGLSGAEDYIAGYRNAMIRAALAISENLPIPPGANFSEGPNNFLETIHNARKGK